MEFSPRLRKTKRKSPGLTPGSVVESGEKGWGPKRVPGGRHVRLSPCGVGSGCSGASPALRPPGL